MACSKLEENPNIKILIVCPRLTLIQQWIDSIKDYSKIQEDEIYEVSSNNESKAYICAQNKLGNYKVFISTFHQIKQFFNQCDWKNHEWFLIVDEMHNTTEDYRFPDAPIKYKLGLSATPKKKGKNADFNLGGIVYTYSFQQALKDKIILNPVIKIVFYSVNKQLFKKIDSSESETTDLLDSAYDDFLDEGAMQTEMDLVSKKGKKSPPKKNPESNPKSELIPAEEAEFFTSKSTDFIGIQRILEEQFRIGQKDSLQTLVFVNRIKKADLLNAMLAQRFSFSVSHSYHSKSESYSQKNNFNRIKQSFAQGKFNVLISVGTLGEGIDFPYASHGIIASPIYNPTAFVQKVGRLLRSYKNHTQAVIYYYVPSELIARLLTDPKIEPNYFKAIIKIADENKDLYFVDRESMAEERGTLSELLVQGSAYERNEDVKRIKVPHDLDAIMRLFKRIYPENLKEWKRLYSKQADDLIEEKRAEKNAPVSMDEIQKEIDFTPLRIELSKNHHIILKAALNLKQNLENIEKLQKKFSKKTFPSFAEVKSFVKEALRLNVITKIKYGQELEDISKDNSKLLLSEQEMLVNAVNAELIDFCSKQKELVKHLKYLDKSIAVLQKQLKIKSHDPKSVKPRIDAMSHISKSFFDLQSFFLDELDLSELAKNVSEKEKKFFITIGRDIFLTKHFSRPFSYPEDFGLSRWQEIKEEEKPVKIELSPPEKFCKKLMHDISNEDGSVNAITDWNSLKQRICSELHIHLLEDKLILAELEKHKFEREFSFEKLFFVTEAILKAQKK
jgi:superfamily II DNA or RNA helicase